MGEAPPHLPRWFYDEAACAVGMATLPMLILLMLVLVRTEFFDQKKLNLVLVTRWLLAAADWLMCFFKKATRLAFFSNKSTTKFYSCILLN